MNTAVVIAVVGAVAVVLFLPRGGGGGAPPLAPAGSREGIVGQTAMGVADVVRNAVAPPLFEEVSVLINAGVNAVNEALGFNREDCKAKLIRLRFGIRGAAPKSARSADAAVIRSAQSTEACRGITTQQAQAILDEYRRK